MAKSITCRDLLSASAIDEEHVIDGKELVRLFWTIKQRENDLARQERYWATVRDALTKAYEELERLKAELQSSNEGLEKRVAEQVGEIVKHAQEVEALNVQLQAKVQERSRELMLALRRAGSGAESAILAPGVVVGQRARIVRRIGDGGMGSVYAADDLLTSRPVALKILRKASHSALRYFVAEAEAASVVSHPAVVRTLFVDVTEDGQIYQLMDLVDGVSLAQHMKTTSLSPGAAARICGTIAAALAAAHEHGVVHRDIKPDNVLLSNEGPGVHVLDFGIAKRLFVDAQTVAEGLIGTPVYMSPDQILSPNKVTPAADVYSLGVVLFEMLVGKRPFDDEAIEAVLFGHLNRPAPSITELAATAPPDLAAIAHACLEKEPDSRPKAGELSASLQTIADALGAPPGHAIGRDAKQRSHVLDATNLERA